MAANKWNWEGKKIGEGKIDAWNKGLERRWEKVKSGKKSRNESNKIWERHNINKFQWKEKRKLNLSGEEESPTKEVKVRNEKNKTEKEMKAKQI